jgi:uncharacterized membrane protein
MVPTSPHRFAHHGAFGNDRFGIVAAYAAPLILLAQTRQADRDKLRDTSAQEHREAENQRVHEFEERQTEVLGRERLLAEQHLTLLAQNTKLTEEIARLTADLHATICTRPASPLDGPPAAPA